MHALLKMVVPITLWELYLPDPGNFKEELQLLQGVRPGKVDSLFPISHFLNFDAGGWSLFIMTSHLFNFTMYIKIFFT